MSTTVSLQLMMPKIVVMYVITITGGTFYVSKFPESFFPGKLHVLCGVLYINCGFSTCIIVCIALLITYGIFASKCFSPWPAFPSPPSPLL